MAFRVVAHQQPPGQFTACSLGGIACKRAGSQFRSQAEIGTALCVTLSINAMVSNVGRCLPEA